MKLLPSICPSCKHFLKVSRLCCEKCETAVEGSFDLPLLAQFLPDEQEFILNFIKASGSLKSLANSYRVSYPTVRNRLDELIQKIKLLEDSK